MKKWTMMIATLIILITSINSAYAVQDLDEYSETIPNDGRIIMKFYTSEKESSPVKGVNVEIFYKDENGEINIEEMEELENTTINLVSDDNGIVIINNLPYGMYRYKVVSVPFGFKENSQEDYFTIEMIDKTERIDIELEREVKLDEVDEDEEIKDNEEDNKQEVKEPEEEPEKEEEEEVIVTPEENITEDVKMDEQREEDVEVEENEDDEEDDNPVITTIQTLTTTDEVKEEPEKIIVDKTVVKEIIDENKISDIKDDMLQKKTASIRERINKPKEDMIKAFMEYRISDSIKVAIDTIGTTRDTYSKMLADMPDQDDKNKKIKRFDRYIVAINDIHKQRA